MTELEEARARAPKATDPGHVHAVKRTWLLSADRFEICRCGLCRREGDGWRYAAAYNR